MRRGRSEGERGQVGQLERFLLCAEGLVDAMGDGAVGGRSRAAASGRAGETGRRLCAAGGGVRVGMGMGEVRVGSVGRGVAHAMAVPVKLESFWADRQGYTRTRAGKAQSSVVALGSRESPRGETSRERVA